MHSWMILVAQGTCSEWQFRDQRVMGTILEMHVKGQEIPAREWDLHEKDLDGESERETHSRALLSVLSIRGWILQDLNEIPRLSRSPADLIQALFWAFVHRMVPYVTMPKAWDFLSQIFFLPNRTTAGAFWEESSCFRMHLLSNINNYMCTYVYQFESLQSTPCFRENAGPHTLLIEK